MSSHNEKFTQNNETRTKNMLRGLRWLTTEEFANRMKNCVEKAFKIKIVQTKYQNKLLRFSVVYSERGIEKEREREQTDFSVYGRTRARQMMLLMATEFARGAWK